MVVKLRQKLRKWKNYKLTASSGLPGSESHCGSGAPNPTAKIKINVKKTLSIFY